MRNMWNSISGNWWLGLFMAVAIASPVSANDFAEKVSPSGKLVTINFANYTTKDVEVIEIDANFVDKRLKNGDLLKLKEEDRSKALKGILAEMKALGGKVVKTISLEDLAKVIDQAVSKDLARVEETRGASTVTQNQGGEGSGGKSADKGEFGASVNDFDSSSLTQDQWWWGWGGYRCGCRGWGGWGYGWPGYAVGWVNYYWPASYAWWGYGGYVGYYC